MQPRRFLTTERRTTDFCALDIIIISILLDFLFLKNGEGSPFVSVESINYVCATDTRVATRVTRRPRPPRDRSFYFRVIDICMVYGVGVNESSR